MKIDHWMTFGTFAEQRYFVYPSPSVYSGVIINGNMAAHAPEGLAGFLLEKTKGLPYIIDPLTHAFQHDPYAILDKQGKPKSSIKILADIYGEPVLSSLGKKPLSPMDFNGDKLKKEFLKKCLDFQRKQLSDAMEKSDVVKYLDDAEKIIPPYALIAPYFYMTETNIGQWLDLCCEFSRLALNEKTGNEKIFSAVVIDQGILLRKDLIDQITSAFKNIALDGFLVWVDGLDEHDSGSEELKGLLSISRALRQNGKREVINLHGGYFSILAAGVLGNSAFSGVAHGPEFGEYRSVVPVGGGIPIARYYLRSLHTRTRYREAVHLINSKKWLVSATEFHKNVCDCEVCKATLAGDPKNFTLFGAGKIKERNGRGGILRVEYPTGETKERCLKHYLNNKSIEYQFSATASKQLIIKDLKDGVGAFENVAGTETVSHLNIWESVFG